MLANGDTFQSQFTAIAGHGDETEICRSTTEITNKDQISDIHLLAPICSLIFQPGVKSGERFLKKCGLFQSALSCGIQSQSTGNLIERRRNRQDCVGGGYFDIGIRVFKILQQVIEDAARYLGR